MAPLNEKHASKHAANASGPVVFVLLPVHNRRQVTRQFIDCLAAQTYPKVQLVVIDDGSSDGTAEMVRQTVPGAVVLEGDGSLWWSGCMQRGYEWLAAFGPAGEDLVLLANDDINFEPNFLKQAVARLEQEPHALLGARLRNGPGGIAAETGVHADLRRFKFETAESAQEINCLPTRALILRWADMCRVGGFHPRLLPQYWADYEYTLRAHRLGMRCVTSSDVTITADMNTTGYHCLDTLVGWRFLRRLFSIKTPLNPLYRTWFVLLASSWLWKPFGVANVWFRAGFRIVWQGILHLRFPRKTGTRVSVI